MKTIVALTLVAFISGCTYVNVDKIEIDQPVAIQEGESIVILKAEHPQAVTESSLISCLNKHLRKSNPKLNVLKEKEFVNNFYPWFEPEVAPSTPGKLEELMTRPLVVKKLSELKLNYLIWVTGSTESHDNKLALACGPQGCLGFGSWKNTGNYEAIIWRLDRLSHSKVTDSNTSDTTQASRLEIGRISTDATGTSYLPAVVVPLPILARVQARACTGMGKELAKFFSDASA